MLRQSEIKVVTPGSLSEALLLLSEHRDTARPLAGGTDSMVRVKDGAWRAPLWVHIRRLAELNQIREVDGRIEIGSAVPYGRMLRSDLLRRKAPPLLKSAPCRSRRWARSARTSAPHRPPATACRRSTRWKLRSASPR